MLVEIVLAPPEGTTQGRCFRQINISWFPRGEQGEIGFNITYLNSDVVEVDPYDSYPLVITIQHGN